MPKAAELKPGDSKYDSEGNCIINLGFIPDRVFVDANGNYVAEDDKGNKREGTISLWRLVLS